MRSQRGPRQRREPNGPTAGLARDLRKRRMALHLTQQEVADLADLARSTVLDLESGRGGTSLESAAAVAEVLGLQLTVAPRTPLTGHGE
ncbi:MAG TPA: helix-turn-helix transcriptional regulator [Actinomycetota bacterium]|nr:helix-turn-helix transcriptional regulator [Actinomycetota bacterium]